MLRTAQGPSLFLSHHDKYPGVTLTTVQRSHHDPTHITPDTISCLLARNRVNYLRGAEFVALSPWPSLDCLESGVDTGTPEVGSEHNVSRSRLSLSPVNSGSLLKNFVITWFN